MLLKENKMAAKRNSKKGKRTMKQRIVSIVALLVIAALLVTTLLSMALTVSAAESDTDTDTMPTLVRGIILENVSIGPVDVGGMDQAEAKAALADYVEEVSEGTTTLQGDLSSVEVSNADLGLSIDAQEAVQAASQIGFTGDLLSRYQEIKTVQNEGACVSVGINVDAEAAEAVLLEYEEELESTAEDYGLTRENGEFVITGGTVGSQIDIEASIEAIIEFYASDYSSDGTVMLVTEVQEPEGDLESLQKVQDVLGTYTTTYSSSSNRGNNIEVAAGYLDGTVLYPGESLSVSDAIQERTEENGYLAAGSYENGTTVDTIGGGICQVSTTLYNAVLNAELQVDTRYPHSLTVSYVAASRDAAISAGSKDFVFTNDTDAPIYIAASAYYGTLTFTIYGEETRAENRTIEFESVTTSTTDPEVVYQADSSLSFGTITCTQSGHSGKTAQLWKIIYIDGVETERVQVNSSTYSVSNTIYSVGTKTDNSTAKANLIAAIASNDRSEINAVIAAGDSTSSSSTSSDTTESTTSDDSTSTGSSSSSDDDTAEDTASEDTSGTSDAEDTETTE